MSEAPKNKTTITQRLDAYEALLRLDKPIGILLLLWPTLWGLWLAKNGAPHLGVAWLFVMGTVLTRSAGCAINDYADRNIDGKVARTQQRPLAQGLIAPWEAIAVAAVLALVAFVLVLVGLDPFVKWWAIAAAVIAVIYPFLKRFFPMPQAWLGIAFSFGIPMAFAQQYGKLPFPLTCWLLVAATWFWVVAYDTMYAMVDREDDLKIGVRSSAIFFGKADVPIIGFCYIAFFALLIAVGVMTQRSVIYYGLLAIAAFAAWRCWRPIATREPAQCFKAFLRNNWVGAWVFLALVFDSAPIRMVGR